MPPSQDDKITTADQCVNRDQLKQEIIKELLANILPSHRASGSAKMNSLWLALKDIPAMRLNIKNFGYNLGIQLAQHLGDVNYSGEPGVHDLISKPSTQKDIESEWFAYWCNELKVIPLYHRKLWEFAFCLQSLQDLGALQPGKKGFGFGCGEEPLASYFSSRNIYAVVSDLSPEQSVGMGWSDTGQHTSSLDKAYHPKLVNKEQFSTHVSHMFIDMNDIPDVEEPYDFCWSICALEHLGSIEKGLNFIENSLKVLKPGGVAIHTTEYNYMSETETIDNYPIVLFLKKHFIGLKEKLAAKGHRLLGPSFDVGNQILDRFIDLPPYAATGEYYDNDGTINDYMGAHLKLSLNGFPSTCYGLIIIKAERDDANSY